jgi:hypothetical protein
MRWRRAERGGEGRVCYWCRVRYRFERVCHRGQRRADPGQLRSGLWRLRHERCVGPIYRCAVHLPEAELGLVNANQIRGKHVFRQLDWLVKVAVGPRRFQICKSWERCSVALISISQIGAYKDVCLALCSIPPPMNPASRPAQGRRQLDDPNTHHRHLEILLLRRRLQSQPAKPHAVCAAVLTYAALTPRQRRLLQRNMA